MCTCMHACGYEDMNVGACVVCPTLHWIGAEHKDLVRRPRGDSGTREGLLGPIMRYLQSWEKGVRIPHSGVPQTWVPSLQSTKRSYRPELT